MPKFLIIRFSSIGDIVLTTPVVRCLKKQVAGAEVHFLTKSIFSEILQYNPYIDKIHLYKDNLKQIIETLKKEEFDFVIDLHHNLRSLRVKRALGVKSFSFNKINIEKWLMTTLKINKLPCLHIVDRYLATLNHWGVVNDGGGLDYYIPQNAEISLDVLPEPHKKGFAGLVIGAALATKQMPISKWREICQKLPYPIVLLGGHQDLAAGEFIANELPNVFNSCGKFSINQSADLVRKAKIIICHDTGLMHIAAAFNKPVISIWGNTIPEFGMSPYFPKDSPAISLTYEVKNLSCRPCSKIGYSKCPKKHFSCMNNQNSEEILAKAVELLK